MIDYIELVRLLEQRNHRFASEPDKATQLVQATSGDVLHRLHQRAKIMDATQEIQSSLHHWQSRLAWFKTVLCVVWAILGFVATFALMQQSNLQFFLILWGVLGANTLMLLWWLWRVLRPNKTRYAWQNALLRPKSDNPIQQALWQHTLQQQQTPHGRWRMDATAHQLALCSLLGMFVATLLLLTVRQYTFDWQSTLLQAPTLAKWVYALSWLPAQLGWQTPNEHMVYATQNQANVQAASAWANLLLGSIICYGIAPRLLAWLLCWAQQKRHQTALDLRLPYYQNIVQKWQQRITDSADDYRPDAPQKQPAPQIVFSENALHWAVLLDSPSSQHQPNWFAQTLGHDWVDHGSVAERSEFAQVQAALVQENVQLLIGIRAASLPDRGNVRRIQQLASQAQSGVVLRLLHNDNESSLHQETAQQWRDVAQENAWVCLD